MGGGRAVLLAALTFACALPASAQAPDTLETRGLGPGWGEASAPIQVVEFTDPSCPYCADFHSGARDSLFADFVEPGHARWTTLPYVSGLYGNSATAAAALVCAYQAGGPESFHHLLTALYRTREGWVGASRPAAREHILASAGAAGLDVKTGHLAACLDTPATVEAVSAIRAMALENGVRGTPTYFVDGFPLMGALPYPFVKRIFDQRLERDGG